VNKDQAATSSTTAEPQSSAAPAGNQANEGNQAALPQTASPLPLLGLLGFGATAAGAFLRRRK
jgi:LPXTG-motif cell wall-anchored protein